MRHARLRTTSYRPLAHTSHADGRVKLYRGGEMMGDRTDSKLESYVRAIKLKAELDHVRQVLQQICALVEQSENDGKRARAVRRIRRAAKEALIQRTRNNSVIQRET